MSLASPKVQSSTIPFVCSNSEGVLSVLEKCLDNGLGRCLIVGEDKSLIGRISLDDIRAALLDGRAITDSSLAWYVGDPAVSMRNDAGSDQLLQPVLNKDGRLAGVLVDKSELPIQVAAPHLTRHEFRSLLDAFISSWISSRGPYVQKLERDFSEFVGVEHGVAVSNGTVALHLALVALGIGPGDEVIVPDLTFAATINAVLYCGATPVIVDIDERTWCLTRARIEQACTSRTKAIIPVHLYGRPAEMAPIIEFAQQRDIAVVEDCAEAHGARYAGHPVGQFGDVSCFSFYANKIITTGEGGICLTRSEKLAQSLRVLRDHGMSPDRAYWHERVGYNYRITNLQAAIGQSQLCRVKEVLHRNARIAMLYRQALRGIPGVTFPPPMSKEYEPVVWLASALVPAEKRSQLILAARARGIETRPFFHPLSSLPPYKAYSRECPNSIALSAKGINLPTSAAVDEQVVQRIGSIFRDVLS